MEQIKNIHNNSLILKGKPEETEHYSIRMILEKTVPNILALDIKRLNNDADYYYDITGLQSIKEYLGKKLLNEKLVKLLLSSIINQLNISKEFLLIDNDFLLSIDGIFIEPLSQNIFFSYKKNYNQDVKKQIEDLIEFFLENVDYEDKNAVLLVYGLYKKSREDWNCQDLWNILNNTEPSCEIKEERKFAENDELNCYAQNNMPLDKFTNNNRKNEHINYNNQVRIENSSINKNYNNFEQVDERRYKNEVKKTYSIWVWIGCTISVLTCLGVLIFLTTSGFLFDKTTGELYLARLVLSFTIIGVIEIVLLNTILKDKDNTKKSFGNDVVTLNKGQNSEVSFSCEQENTKEETVILSTREERLCLYPTNFMEYEEINIIEFPFFIGKLKTKVNGMIENRIISRYHARIDAEKEVYYITDLNSTNGTFLNGQKLYPNQKEEIKFEDFITFANIEYKFIRK